MIQAGTWLGSGSTGWPSEIERICRLAPQLLDQRGHAVISRLDSHRPVSLAIPPLGRLRTQGALNLSDVPGGVLTDGPTVVRLSVEHKLFTGFDEIWFFLRSANPAVPDQATVLANRWMSDPQFRYRPYAMNLDELSEWMANAGVELGLADGLGLEYATNNARLARELEDALALPGP